MKKLYPDNNHHDGYDESIGWIYLGNDENHDYYVNHSRKWLSIVYSNEDSDYGSPDYNNVIQGRYPDRYPTNVLTHMIGEHTQALKDQARAYQQSPYLLN
jgi:hypothetical protein